MDHRGVLLETERLRLRRLSLDDAPALADLDREPDVLRFVSREPPRSADTYREQILPRLLALYELGPGIGFWAAEELTDDRFVGWFHLRPDADDETALEVGYRLTPRIWGRGLATEGTRALVAWAFESLGAPRVTARALEANAASRRVLEKSGLRLASRFTYPPEALRGFAPEEARAVLYRLDHPTPPTPASPPPTTTLDVRGLLCPLPVLRAARAIDRLAPGDRLDLRGSDPAMIDDLPAWCDATGHHLLEIARDPEGVVRCLIEKSAAPASPPTGPPAT